MMEAFTPWQQNVLLAHRRTELFHQQKHAPSIPPPIPDTLYGQEDSLGNVDMGEERKRLRQKRLGIQAEPSIVEDSASSPTPSISPRKNLSPRKAKIDVDVGGELKKGALHMSALVPHVGERVQGFWLGRHAGKDTQSGLGPGMIPKAKAARGERFAGFYPASHAGKDTESGLGPGMVPMAKAARGEGFADWYQGKHAGRDAKSNLGPGMVPRHGRRAM